MQEQKETAEQIKAIRSKLIKTEQSEICDQTIEQIWIEARKSSLKKKEKQGEHKNN